jgi:hypothetical protein
MWQISYSIGFTPHAFFSAQWSRVSRELNSPAACRQAELGRLGESDPVARHGAFGPCQDAGCVIDDGHGMVYDVGNVKKSIVDS